MRDVYRAGRLSFSERLQAVAERPRGKRIMAGLDWSLGAPNPGLPICVLLWVRSGTNRDFDGGVARSSRLAQYDGQICEVGPLWDRELFPVIPCPEIYAQTCRHRDY